MQAQVALRRDRGHYSFGFGIKTNAFKRFVLSSVGILRGRKEERGVF